jgi:hypothetical protein
MVNELYEAGEDVRYVRYVYHGTGITCFNCTVLKVIDEEKRIYKLLDKRCDETFTFMDTDIEEQERKIGKGFGQVEYLDRGRELWQKDKSGE